MGPTVVLAGGFRDGSGSDALFFYGPGPTSPPEQRPKLVGACISAQLWQQNAAVLSSCIMRGVVSRFWSWMGLGPPLPFPSPHYPTTHAAPSCLGEPTSLRSHAMAVRSI